MTSPRPSRPSPPHVYGRLCARGSARHRRRSAGHSREHAGPSADQPPAPPSCAHRAGQRCAFRSFLQRPCLSQRAAVGERPAVVEAAAEAALLAASAAVAVAAQPAAVVAM
eukprot:2065869-Prymnesium_polylepis.3